MLQFLVALVFVILPVASAAAQSAGASAPGTNAPLSGVELRQAIVGNTLAADSWRQYLDPAGSVHEVSARNSSFLQDRGRYEIRGNRFCTIWPSRAGQELCTTIARRDGAYVAYNADGTVFATFRIERSNPYAL
jgi:hypothetical protein